MERKKSKDSTSMPTEFAPGVYWMEIGRGVTRSNVYFVRSGSSWVLIDTASPNCGPLIRSAAETLFGANTPPAAILLTHDHTDHAGSAMELARLWDRPVYVHPDEMPLVRMKDAATVEKYSNPLSRWTLVPVFRAMSKERVESMFASVSFEEVAQLIDPGVAVPGLPGWECLHVPGHTPGHVAFFRASDRCLITGDAVLTADLNSVGGALTWSLRRNKQKVSGPPWYTTWNWQAAQQSVAVLAALEPCVLASGHGVPMSGGEIARELHAVADRLK
jgi:glyoxylase-like metal-dependent hydrolase (beta-lactamase superfamily II)